MVIQLEGTDCTLGQQTNQCQKTEGVVVNTIGGLKYTRVPLFG